MRQSRFSFPRLVSPCAVPEFRTTGPDSQSRGPLWLSVQGAPLACPPKGPKVLCTETDFPILSYGEGRVEGTGAKNYVRYVHKSSFWRFFPVSFTLKKGQITLKYQKELKTQPLEVHPEQRTLLIFHAEKSDHCLATTPQTPWLEDPQGRPENTW